MGTLIFNGQEDYFHSWIQNDQMGFTVFLHIRILFQELTLILLYEVNTVVAFYA